MKQRSLALVAIAVAAAMATGLTQAKPFKWASQGDVASWDIHAQNNALHNAIHAYVYESLVTYNSKTFQVEPLLATSWQEVTPRQMRFTLRQGVKFQDGSAFTAEDAVFSINRAMVKTSNSISKSNVDAKAKRGQYGRTASEADKVHV